MRTAGDLDFQERTKTGGAEARSNADENSPILKMFEREDWTLFRTVEGLQQKAGVPASRLRRLVLKELGDNALDTGATVRVGRFGDRFFVEDDGPGLDGTPEDIAALFSIRRPMRSSKLLRLPQRGALGNGLREVAGAVLASEGALVVITRNRRIELQPKADGTTLPVNVTAVDRPMGTRIEIGFGPDLPKDPEALAWIRAAQNIAEAGDSYCGATSAWWYDAAHFHELLLASGAQPVRSLIAQLDGCSGGKAGEIVADAGLGRMGCKDVSRQQAAQLLSMTRAQAKPVTPERLGGLGRNCFPNALYALVGGRTAIGGSKPQADIPFAVEAWASKLEKPGDKCCIIIYVNRTPSTGDIRVYRDSDKDLCIVGSSLNHYTEKAPKKGAYTIAVNVTTPYCPITSDGKAPDLTPFKDAIMSAVATATRKAQRAAPKDKKVSQRDVVLDNLDEVITAVGGNGKYRFNTRQIYYQMRPIILAETGLALQIGNFTTIITDYENDNGEIPGMYREPRGSIYHPHRRETIPLGTLVVEKYRRPIWTFNKLVYIEKEGFSEALKEDGWAERHDCTLISSKGFSTRAARDLVDKLAEHDEPVDIFCVHDADAYGTMIYQTFQEATKARGARKIRIVNLGLEPWEAVEADLEVEEVPEGEQRKAVASYVLEHDRGEYWEDWLQRRRVELNAMTTPEFIEWLDTKMAEHGAAKLIPPDDVIVDELERRLEAKMRATITERILREAGLEEQIAAALAAIKRPSAADLRDGIKQLFDSEPESEWRNHVEAASGDTIKAANQ
jgi:hypothetical protein